MAISAGFFYILIGLFGARVGVVFAAFPHELVLAIAGLALLGTIGNGLVTALSHEPATGRRTDHILVTASGVTLLGIGFAFWGLSVLKTNEIALATGLRSMLTLT